MKSSSRQLKRRLQPPSLDENPETVVYNELLAEEAPLMPNAEARPPKRRRKHVHESKTLGYPGHTGYISHNESRSIPLQPQPRRQPRTAYDDPDSSSSSSASSQDSEFELDFEDVPLESTGPPTAEDSVGVDGSFRDDIVVDLDAPTHTITSKGRRLQRSPSTLLEKQKRLDIHKVHACCLLAHAYIRNSWCNDRKIQAILRILLSNRTINYLNPSASKSQFERSRSFTDGLQQASDAFRLAYRVTTPGLERPKRVTRLEPFHSRQGDKCSNHTVTRGLFNHTTKILKGSRDLGAQLFCSLLRSVAVDARLVCSLQVLPLNTAAPHLATPPDEKRTITESGLVQNSVDLPATLLTVAHTSGINSPVTSDRGLVVPIKRFGQTGAIGERIRDLGKRPPSPKRVEPIVQSKYPVYWVEAFNTAAQQWLPVDPMVTGTVAKPTKLEPPANDTTNSMGYVVAFEDDGSAKDVTRRYARAYNAKTRRFRVEATKGGTLWWKKTLSLFHNGESDRDQIENATLARKEASEPMPRNIQDFKDHPLYVLERHLRHNEVINPRKEVGKVTSSKNGSTTEPVFRRKDVQVVRSSVKWYQLGRDVQKHEQPLKYAKPHHYRPARSISPDANADAEDQDNGIGLYADHQTTLHIPPPVVNGIVPTNLYGNLDVYVPSMIPRGGVHIRALEAAKAAKIVGVAYADAVTGFRFKGRKGIAIVVGVVVAKEYAAAVEETVRGLRHLQRLTETHMRTQRALKMWQSFIVGLRIIQRVGAYADIAEENSDIRQRIEIAEGEDHEKLIEGGFVRSDAENMPPEAYIDTSPYREALATTEVLDFNHSADRAELDVGDWDLSEPSPWDSENDLMGSRDTTVTSTNVGRRRSMAAKATWDAEQEDVQSAHALREVNNHAASSNSSQYSGPVAHGESGGGFLVANERSHSPAVSTVACRTGHAEEAGFDTGELPNDPVSIAANVTRSDQVLSANEQVVAKDSFTFADNNEASNSHAVFDLVDAHEAEEVPDDESLLSHDPEDDEAEPDWL